MRASRMMGALALAGAALALTACEGEPPLQFQVTSAADTADASPGDGICADDDGSCTLRAAVDESNANAAPVTIVVPSGTYELTRPGTDDDNAGGDLDLDPMGARVVLLAEPGGAEIVDTTHDGQVIDVRGDAGLSQLSVTGSDGDGIRVRDGASASIGRSTTHGNAGAGVAVDAEATLTLESSTVTGNGEAGVANDGQALLSSATITANSGGGLAGTGTTILGSSIVADQTNGADCGGAVISGAYNLVSDGTCGLDAVGDLEGRSAALGPATSDLVPVHVPESLSPAVDSIPVGTAACGSDDDPAPGQRGADRPRGPACTRGAVESGYEVLEHTDFTSLPPGELPSDWNDCSTAWRHEFAPLGVAEGGGVGVTDAYAAVTPTEAAEEGQLPGIGCAWKTYGATAGRAVSVEVGWTGAIPLEGTPLLHVSPAVGGGTPGIREMGLGAWPAHGILPACCVLLGGTLGNPPEDFRVLLDALASFGPAQPTRIALRSDDLRFAVWLETPDTGEMVMRSGPLDLPTDLQGSISHGMAVDAHYATPEYPTLYEIDPLPTPEDAAIVTHTVSVYSD